MDKAACSIIAQHLPRLLLIVMGASADNLIELSQEGSVVKKTISQLLKVTVLSFSFVCFWGCKPPAKSGLEGTQAELSATGLAVGFPDFVTSNTTPGCSGSGVTIRLSKELDRGGPSLRNHRICFQDINLTDSVYSSQGEFESGFTKKFVLAPEGEIEIKQEKTSLFQLCSEQAPYLAYTKVRTKDSGKPVRICSIEKDAISKITSLVMRPKSQKDGNLTLYQLDLGWLEDLTGLRHVTIRDARIYQVEALSKLNDLTHLSFTNVLMPEKFANNLNFLRFAPKLKKFVYKPVLTRAELINTDGLASIPLAEHINLSIPGETYKSIEGLKELGHLIQRNHFIGLDHDVVLKHPMPFAFFYRSYGVSYLDWIKEVSL